MNKVKEYRALYAFSGMGGGAIGGQRAEVHLMGKVGRVRVIGGIDSDAGACRDFEMFTGAPTLCVDITALTPDELRAFAGQEAPDFVFFSPPCKGGSALLSSKKAATPKYQEMNMLALRWVELMLRTWSKLPKFLLLENVPRLKQRAKPMLKQLRALLRKVGYVLDDSFHDCGELGGLAQVRKRYLLVARDPKQVPTLLYKPPKKRVRGCGEVLSLLPLPGDTAGGAMHRLPRLSWTNWVRLALIPAGGDWRDLEGVVKEGQARREVFRRHHVQRWEDPSATVAGSGSNGPSNVADPRFGNVDRVIRWEDPTGCVTAAPAPSSGGDCVADPRFGIDSGCKHGSHESKLRIEDWAGPAHTLTGSDRVGSGAPSVADERARGWFGNVLRVKAWEEPAAAVTGGARPTNGGGAVCDQRPNPLLFAKQAYDHACGVLRWDEPSSVVAGGSDVGQGAYSVADSRYRGAYGVLGWFDPTGVITGNARPPTGTFSVADPRFPIPADILLDCEPRSGSYGVLHWRYAAATITGAACHDNGRFSVADPRKPPSFTPLIIAEDGTWHRPITTYECLALQSFPTMLKGQPVVLEGKNNGDWRERIGNAVPPDASVQIHARILFALLEADMGGFSLNGDLPVWVKRETRFIDFGEERVQ